MILIQGEKICWVEAVTVTLCQSHMQTLVLIQTPFHEQQEKAVTKSTGWEALYMIKILWQSHVLERSNSGPFGEWKINKWPYNEVTARRVEAHISELTDHFRFANDRVGNFWCWWKNLKRQFLLSLLCLADVPLPALTRPPLCPESLRSPFNADFEILPARFIGARSRVFLRRSTCKLLRWGECS